MFCGFSLAPVVHDASIQFILDFIYAFHRIGDIKQMSTYKLSLNLPIRYNS